MTNKFNSEICNVITLISGPKEVKAILGKTKAQFFVDLKVGNVIECTLVLANPGRGRGLYATYIKVRNITTGTKSSDSLTMISKYLDNFELVDFIPSV